MSVFLRFMRKICMQVQGICFVFRNFAATLARADEQDTAGDVTQDRI